MKLPILTLSATFAILLTGGAQAAPYRNLTLMAEVHTGSTPATNRYEYRGTVTTQNVLGETVRVATGTNAWFGYKLGSDLQFDRPYVIEVVYPEDVPRAYLMALMDCGGSQPGSHYAFHTGVYEAETYAPPSDSRHEPRNLTAYPLRQQFKSYWMIAWPQRKYWWDSSKFTEFQTSELRNPDGSKRPGTSHGTFDTGLWLYFINKADDPHNQGVAVQSIRIYSVGSIDDLVDPLVDQLRVRSPRRTFWTLESPGRNTLETQAARARIAGANTLVPVFMDWNFNFRASYTPWLHFRTAFRSQMRIAKAARAHGLGIIPKLEYGGSNNLPEAGKAFAIEKQFYDWMDPATNRGLRYQFHGRTEERRIDVRSQEARSELKQVIDVLFEEAGDDADLIKGIMLRNRCGYFGPSFKDADLAAFETETGTTIPPTEANPPISGETVFDKKRRTLHQTIPWEPKWASDKTHGVKIQQRRTHPYMQWTYAKIAEFVEDIKQHLHDNYGKDKVLIYHQFTGEGIFVKYNSNESEIMAGEEWGFVPGINAAKTFLPLMPVDQYWNAGSTANLNALASQEGTAVLADPMYIEYLWVNGPNDLNGFPYTRLAPVYEHGGQEYSIRTEILATARTNPRMLGRSAFTTIHRGAPEAWNAFAKNYYLLPNETGTTVLDNPNTVTVKSFSQGRVLVINKSLLPQTVNLSASYPTLHDKITGNIVNPAALTLGPCSMQLFGTQPGGVVPAPLPLPPPTPYRHIIQAETGTVGNVNGGSSTGGFIDLHEPYSHGLVYGFGNAGSYVSIPVSVGAAGNQDIAVRYSSAVAGRPIRLDVNGQTVVPNVELPLTGHKNEFLAYTFSAVPLNAGTNLIRLVAVSNAGPGIDEIEIIAPNDHTMVYFQDDFNLLSAANWSAGISSIWSLQQDTDDYVYVGKSDSFHSGYNIAGESWWKNYQIDLDFKVSNMKVWSYTYVYGRYVDVGNHYSVSFELTDNGTRIRLNRLLNGVATVLGSTYVGIPLETWHHLTWRMSGAQHSVMLNGISVINVSDPTSLPSGKIGLAVQKQAVSFDNILVTGLGRRVYQAEDHSARQACTFGNTNEGFLGEGYMRFDADGSHFEWNTVNEEPGSKTLVFRYVNGSAQNRPAEVYRNGTLVGTVPFPPTGSWSTWGTASLPGVQLDPGHQTIRLKAKTWNNGPGAADIDQMEIH
jgi:hypothetical protein